MDRMKGVIIVLNLLFMLSGSVLAVSFLLHSATKSKIKKDNELQRVPTKKMLKMRRVTGQIMGVSAAVLLFVFAINLSSPSKDVGVSETNNVEGTETESDSQIEEQVKLGPYSVAAIPNNVPSSYIIQYKELANIISRADATLRLIKNTINKCESPCPKPLSEIEQQFLLLSEIIDETRNELFRGSEIIRIMAEENPPGLDAMKLYELQQDLISTEYSLETMQLADSWESWEEPVEYADSTKTKRLYNTPLANTLAKEDYYVEDSTEENGEPIVNEETPEAMQSAENVILGFGTIEEEINAIIYSVHVSSEADYLTGDDAIAFVDSTLEQAVIASNAFKDVQAAKEMSAAIGQLDSLKAKLLMYESIMANSTWNLETYEKILTIVDSFSEDLNFNPIIVKQFLDVYGY